ncbi:NADPH-dependent diflavin oxidoreductase 1 isoform X2 [Tenrec ecaudatus]|uniref:NADPH-dependent diflavin oxidoreductase 1 isoform X2 n=1 Tax=Tenrec ecaudatus TaxID=94439 RepID=UPI003F59B853
MSSSILWPRSCTADCCSLGAAHSCPPAWVMTSMSWGPMPPSILGCESCGCRCRSASHHRLASVPSRQASLYPPSSPCISCRGPPRLRSSRHPQQALKSPPHSSDPSWHPWSPIRGSPVLHTSRTSGCSSSTSLALGFAAGDVVLIQPENSASHVQQFCQLLGLDPDQNFVLQPREPDATCPARLPQPCSVRHLVGRYLDVAGVPRRSLFELLASLSPDELEREKLLEFSSAGGQEALHAYCTRPRRTVLEVLCDFPHTAAAVPPDYLLDLIPPIRPRAFSIASSLVTLPGRLQILVAVVQYWTRLKEPRRGLCSCWLASLDPGQGPVQVPLWVQPGSLTFPETADTPVVMVGPGTGVAPFRAAIQERVARGQTGNVLFFGCRQRDQDFYWEAEWQELKRRGCLTLVTAFSREQQQKVYVQHRLREHGPLVWELINQQGAYFYLAGNAKSMPAEVTEALTSVFQEQGGLSGPDAASYLTGLQRALRFQAETWA